MAKRKHPKHLWIAFIVILIIVILQNIILFLYTPSLTGHVTNATIDLCINTPPLINLSACQDKAFTGVRYNCFVNATDRQQQAFSYAVTQEAGPAAGTPLFVMNGSNMSFTANNSQIGNYTLSFLVDDLSGCNNAVTQTDMNLSIELFSNAPYLVKPLPNETWNANTLRIAFNLNDYFADPNNLPLVYAGYNNTHVRIDIVDGQVLFTPSQNWCGSEQVYFNATNTLNLSGQSNTITLQVNCVSQEQQHNQNGNGGGNGGGGGGNSGNGGGGGGGANHQNQQCIEDYSCFDWSACQLTRVVDPDTGNTGSISITGVLGNRTYEIDPSFQNDINAFYEGYQYKECIDTMQCDNTKERVYVIPCSYKPNCGDHIQNQGETGIDCGGPSCPACDTCTDGIKDGQETGVDCGGPLCKSCNACSDGKIDGQETGVDCGGPDCPACATCFDKIKNQDETGVDCGGKFCKSCSEKETPAAVPFPWLTAILLGLILLVLGIVSYAAIKRQFVAWLMRYLFRHKKTNRVLLIPTSSKDEIIRRLNELELRLAKQPILKSQEQLAGILRDYFKTAFNLDFEFTNEELVFALSKGRLNPLLSKILQAYFTRINGLEFSGVAVQPLVLKALIQEARAIVYQTAVLSVDDLKAAEADLTIEQAPKDAPTIDKAYFQLHQLHLCLQLRRNELSAALYQVLFTLYTNANLEEQRLFYDDLMRVYDEYCFAAGVAPQKR